MSEYKYFLYHKLLVVVVNLMVVATLFISMYHASLYPDDFNHTFFKTIFALLIPTLMTGYFGKRYLRKHAVPQIEQTEEIQPAQAAQQTSQI